jgi:3-oxoacyl-[acyl-carrier-protein] synthase-3
MIGIQRIAAEIPSRRLDVTMPSSSMYRGSGLKDGDQGFTHLARKVALQDSSDLCVAAAEKLLSAERISPAKIESIVVVTQNPDGYGIPHVASLVQARLGVPDRCASFDIGLGGSGYVYGLSVMKSFMEANGLKHGLLLTADPYSRVIADFEEWASQTYGDAATASLLSDAPVWDIGRFDLGTSSIQGEALQVRLQLGGRLYVDTEVYWQYATETMSQSVRKVAALNEIPLDKIDRIFVQQITRPVVEEVGRRLGRAGTVPFIAAEYGDTVSSCVPIALAQNALPSDRIISICGVGSGLSWASTVLRRSDRR